MKETALKLLMPVLFALGSQPVAAQKVPAPLPVSLSAGAQVYADCATADLAAVQVSVLIHVSGGQANNTDVQSGAGTQRDALGKLINDYWDSEASTAWTAPALDLDAVRIPILPIRPGVTLCGPIGLDTRTTRGRGEPIRVLVAIPSGYHFRPLSAALSAAQVAPGAPTTAWAAPPRVEARPSDLADPTRLVLSLPEARPDLYSPAFYTVLFTLDKDARPPSG